MEKQIDEMAKDIACKIAWDEDEIPTVNCLETAKRLYCEGYRKASDVASEIIEDIAELLEANWNDIQHGSCWLTNGRCSPLRELLKNVEKKYTEGEK